MEARLKTVVVRRNITATLRVFNRNTPTPGGPWRELDALLSPRPQMKWRSDGVVPTRTVPRNRAVPLYG
jgi:hypothetical protein